MEAKVNQTKKNGTKKSKDPLVQETDGTYYESVRVNIGDYEHRDLFLSRPIRQKANESFKDAALRAKKEVRSVLYPAEKTLRKKSQRFVDFDTKAKLI